MADQDVQLECWKQIAAYLNRSERTVRRWEATEGLPIHRHEHGKGGTVVAYPHELDRWRTERTQNPDPKTYDKSKGRRWLIGSSLAAVTAGVGAVALNTSSRNEDATSAEASPEPVSGYLTDHEEVTRTVDRYIAGGRAGNGDLMRPAFHPEATVAGFCKGVEYSGSIEHLFEWVDENGPAPGIEPKFARIEIVETIAVVNLEVRGWSGALAGDDARISEIFTLLKREGEWKITQKTFHWYDV